MAGHATRFETLNAGTHNDVSASRNLVVGSAVALVQGPTEDRANPQLTLGMDFFSIMADM